MQIGQLLKFYRYSFAWENYLLLLRVIQAAWLVRKRVQDRAVTPKFSAAWPVIDSFYLLPQPTWHISDAKKIAWFANFIVNFPFRWGRCLQRSLIVYRLLNGYGQPAKLCIGIDERDKNADGHVWVEKLSEGKRGFAEITEPRDRYTVIYTSALPQ